MANNSMTNAITGNNPNQVASGQEAFNQKVQDASAKDSRFVKLLGEQEEYYETLKKLREKSALDGMEADIKATEDALAAALAATQQRMEAEGKSAQAIADAKKALEIEYGEEIKALKQSHADEVARIEENALKVTLQKQENAYKYGTLAEKKALQDRRAANIQAWLEQQKDNIANSRDDSETETQFRLRAIEEVSAARKQARDIERSEQFQNIKEVQDKLSTFKEDAAKGDFSAIGSMLKVAGKGLTDVADEAKKRSQQSQQDLQDMSDEYEAMKKAGASDEELAAKQKEIMEQQAQVMGDELKSVMADFCVNLKDAVGAEFKAAEEMLLSNKAWIEGRLQGSGKTYNKVMNEISSNVSMSPFVKTKDIIKKMQDAVDKGIAYNVEQRSFLAGISDKIANTFDAFDSNLTRLIRLQQADTTAARLGMEASLTKFFNKHFQDNSYLKDVADTISSAIIDANASMSRDNSAEFEYTVQKWLGSLYSLGMDQGTLSEIAKGINYIATGDVQNISNNTSLQTLFAMSASKAGLSYADMLLEGLDAETTNKLLQSMVMYLKEIAEGSDNQVVRSAYGGIFNMSMSDMRAVSNMTSSDIKKIAQTSLNYNGMMSELNNQFVQQITRTTLGSMLSTLYENATFGIAEDLVSNPATYAMYKMLNFMEERKFDMAIPFLNVYGFGLDLNTSVQDLLRLGLGVGSAMSLVGNLLGGLGSLGGMRLDGWNADEYTSRGGGLAFTTQDGGASVSGSTFLNLGKDGGGGSDGSGSDGGDGGDSSSSSAEYVGSGSGEDMQNSSLSSATDDAEETSKTTNKNSDAGYTMDDFYKAVVEGAEPYLRVTDEVLNNVYDARGQYLHTRDNRATYTKDGQLRVYDVGSFDNMYLINEYLKSIDASAGATSRSTETLLERFIKAGNVLVSLANDASDKNITNVVSYTDSLAQVKVTNSSSDSKGLDVFVTNLDNDYKNTAQVVKFEAVPEVKMDKELLINAFREAMGFSSSSRTNMKTMAEIWNAFYTGEKSMNVATPADQSLSVDLTPSSLLCLRMSLL